MTTTVDNNRNAMELTEEEARNTEVEVTGGRLRNTFAAKKTVAQGMMDIALMTANANQLRYLLEFQQESPTFYLSLSLLIISLILQMGVGLLLIFKGKFDMKGEEKLRSANTTNNYVVTGVFLITVVNVFIASFNISPSR